jgi:hypothetical protein
MKSAPRVPDCYTTDLELDGSPSADDKRFLRQAVVVRRGVKPRESGRLKVLGALGDTWFCWSSQAELHAPSAPILSVKNKGGAHVGIDDAINGRDYLEDVVPTGPGAGIAVVRSEYWHAPIDPKRSASPPPRQAIRVAVVDFGFSLMPQLAMTRAATVLPVRVIDPSPMKPAAAAPEGLAPKRAHGAMVVASIADTNFPSSAVRAGAQQRKPLPIVVQPYQLPSSKGEGQGGSPFIGPYHLFLALLDAADRFRADIIVAAIGAAEWGVPSYLQELLRKLPLPRPTCPRGTCLVVAAGAPERQLDNCGGLVVPADDVGSQLGLTAVAPHDKHGFWLRRSGLREGNGAPIGRFGPNIELAGPGYLDAGDSRFGEMPDDSSHAAAHVAGVATLVLRHNPLLSANEVRTLLRATALAPTQPEGRPMSSETSSDEEDTTCSEDQDARAQFSLMDRSGHNFKLGYGCVNPEAAVLAASDPFSYGFYLTKELTVQSLQSQVEDGTFKVAAEWSTLIEHLTKELGTLGKYRQSLVLVRVAIHSFSFRENLLWIVRHCKSLARTWKGKLHNHLALTDRFRLLLRILEDASGLESEVPKDVIDLLRRAQTPRWAEDLSQHPKLDATLLDTIRERVLLHY